MDHGFLKCRRNCLKGLFMPRCWQNNGGIVNDPEQENWSKHKSISKLIRYVADSLGLSGPKERTRWNTKLVCRASFPAKVRIKFLLSDSPYKRQLDATIDEQLREGKSHLISRVITYMEVPGHRILRLQEKKKAGQLPT
ncbi:hypothetical protein T4D_13117 [Trichinella pseudospiralis]|uniref:Uncharacterized protein n=1 Tax=Trichinella pseudospiralis TaxID=6337 RepID=A0A0V1G105_TRIPS|nr:hypothetical protein T4D_13117 [Trichinella pseudospiralis]